MDELVKLVSAKVGLPEAQARQIVELVLTQLKQYLPAPIASQIDGLLKGTGKLQDLNKLEGMVKSKDAEGLLGKLGGLFGRKK